MKNFIPERFTVKGLLVILSIFIIFHLLVLFRVIPFEIVWGGRLEDASQMVSFETVSIGINLFMIAVIAVKGGYFKIKVNPTIVQVVLWLMFVLFVFNTIGNIFSVNPFERRVFTPITLILSILCLRLASTKKGNQK